MRVPSAVLWLLVGMGFATVVGPPYGWWTVSAAGGTALAGTIIGIQTFGDDSLRLVSDITASATEAEDGYYSFNAELVLYAPKQGIVKGWLDQRVGKKVRLTVEELNLQ